MIVVLEGIEGTGKSSIAKIVSEVTDWPIHRPLQLLRSGRSRWDPAEQARYRLANVPVHTYAEDLYQMDILARLCANGQNPAVIMDRSMVSGMVYSGAAHAFFEPESAAWLFEQWTKLAKMANVHVIHLDADVKVCAARRADDPRMAVSNLEHLRRRMEKWMTVWQNASGTYTRIDANQPLEAVARDTGRALRLATLEL